MLVFSIESIKNFDWCSLGVDSFRAFFSSFVFHSRNEHRRQNRTKFRTLRPKTSKWEVSAGIPNQQSPLNPLPCASHRAKNFAFLPSRSNWPNLTRWQRGGRRWFWNLVGRIDHPSSPGVLRPNSRISWSRASSLEIWSIFKPPFNVQLQSLQRLSKVAVLVGFGKGS